MAAVKGLALAIELMNKYQDRKNRKVVTASGLGAADKENQAVQNIVYEGVNLIRQYSNVETQTLDRETLLRLIDKIQIGEQKNYKRPKRT